VLKGLARFFGIVNHCTGGADVLFDLAQWVQISLLGADGSEKINNRGSSPYIL